LNENDAARRRLRCSATMVDAAVGVEQCVVHLGGDFADAKLLDDECVTEQNAVAVGEHGKVDVERWIQCPLGDVKRCGSVGEQLASLRGSPDCGLPRGRSAGLACISCCG
jgi:hypothetical protein